MRQETDGVLLECYLIYEPEHQATWFKDDQVLLGALDFDEKYQVKLHRNLHEERARYSLDSQVSYLAPPLVAVFWLPL